MKNATILLATAVFVLTLQSCKKEPEPTFPTPSTTSDTYTQYGTPMSQVAHADDIIMYEVNMRAFSQTGDFRGVIDGMDRIESLGVNVIWLMPIHPIGEVNSVNSPYSVQDYKSVNPEFGDLQDFRDLVEEAHSRGIAVIIDWVANHTSWDHPWISNRTWYTQDANGNIISPAGTNWADVADLNFESGNMKNAMIDAMKYWVFEANIDGFRCDAADMVPDDFWKRATKEMYGIEGRDLIMLAEGGNLSNFTAGFEMNYAWNFQTQLKNIFLENASAQSIFQTNKQEFISIEEGQSKLRFITNHDIYAWDDTPQSAFNSAEGSVAAMVIATYLQGAALIYNGQEVALSRNISFFDKNPINWNSNPDILTDYKSFMGFYAQSEAAKKGSLTTYSGTDVACFVKSLNDEEVLVMVNTRAEEVNYDIPAPYINTTAVDAISEASVTLDSIITLEPYQYLILRR